MRENVGKLDRATRSVVGPSLILAGVSVLGGARGRPLGLLSMIAGATILESAITRVCPLNAALKVDTRSPQQKLQDSEDTIESTAYDLAKLVGL